MALDIARFEQLGRQLAASNRFVARKVIAPAVVEGDLTLEERGDAATLVEELEVGVRVEAGQVFTVGPLLVEIVQGHTTQADWLESLPASLYRLHRTPDQTEWIARIWVDAGEELDYGGSTYRCRQGHTTQAGWEPPNAPALWELV